MLTPTRKGPSNIPLPSHMGGGATGIPTPMQSDPYMRTGSAASNYSQENTRGGRSSSLSLGIRAGTPTGNSRLPQPQRPVFSLNESPGARISRADSLAGIIIKSVKTRSSSESSADSEDGGAAKNAVESVEDAEDDGERVLPVRVAVRIRPLFVGDQSGTLSRGMSTECVEASGTSVVVAGGDGAGPRSFSYDHVFGPGSAQSDVYDTAVAPLLGRFVEGYNVTVLAYGQTSSGKTFTMGTDAEDIAQLTQPGSGASATGVVPRALQWLFSWASTSGSALPTLREGVEITVSFLEVYNEELIDLAARVQSRGVSPPVFVREDARGNILWVGVREVAVSSAADALDLLLRGSRERQTGGTRMNDKSSRSHAIYSVALTQTRKRASGLVRLHSKLHFVDLAGSERLKKTQAVGERQKEGISINTGLLALGNVISALGDPRRGPAMHIPYRESKLTYMLRDSLGGTALTLLIACISPAEANAAESLNTLQYASRARNIRNRGGVNTVSTARGSAREVESLRAMVRKLKSEVRVLSDRLQAAHDAPSRDSMLIPPASRAMSPSPSPSRIPSAVQARQHRSQLAEEINTLKSRNMDLESQLEQATDNYTELLLKFNDACRDIEEHQNESFERDQRLRTREQELRRLTATSQSGRGASIVSADVSRPTSVADTLRRSVLSVRSTSDADSPASVPEMPDLSHLHNLRTSSVASASPHQPASRDEGPGAAEFDAILEEYDSSVRALEDDLKSAREAIEGLKLQLSMQESKASFAEKLSETQQAQIETLRLQVSKAREAGEEEEQRRRAVEAELEDAQFNAETQLEAVSNDWRLELQHADEQWNERWTAAQQEHCDELERLRTAHEQQLEQVHADAQAELDSMKAEHQRQTEMLHAQHQEELELVLSEHQSELARHQRLSSSSQADLPEQTQLLAEYEAQLAELTRQNKQYETEIAQQRAEYEADLRKLLQQRTEYEAELTEQRAQFEHAQTELQAQISQQQEQIEALLHMQAEESKASSDAAVVVQMPTPQTSSSNVQSETQQQQQYESEIRALRIRALDAEARAASAEEALSVLSAKAVAPETTATGISPAEKRLRAMRGYRYSTIPPQKPSEQASPTSDKFASYPELQLASSADSAPANRPPPVFDADQVQRMLRDAAADAERQAAFDRERQSLLSKIQELKEAKKELQGHNSQFKNLMRDLGEKLVSLAQENDALEARAKDRDDLAQQIERLQKRIEELQTKLIKAGENVTKLQVERELRRSESLKSPPSESATLDDSKVAGMRTRLQNIENELASHLERACQAEEERDRYCNELHRARAELRRLSVKVEEHNDEQDRRKHRFSRLLCLV
ncbi:hypothetical protein H4R22_000731 [Coemansia sp. RSA 1290]|nr:hypothetical protein H4R22_000731 [Coemansia sp. RSA 1290]KAJ2650356.1 hypothetical protein IWW40_002533 [Coemansia sp. RSA 1250]